MKLWSLFLAFGAIAAQDDTGRGKQDGDLKGAQSCQGVQLNQNDFKCKNKKKKSNKRKKCKAICNGASMKKVYCNEDGWGGKGGKKINPNKVC